MAQNLLNFPKHSLILEYEKDLPDNIAVLKLPGSPSRCYVMAIPDPRCDAFKELMSGAAASFDLGTARKQVAELQAARTEAVDELGTAKLENADLAERLKNSDAALVASTTRLTELETQVDELAEQGAALETKGVELAEQVAALETELEGGATPDPDSPVPGTEETEPTAEGASSVDAPAAEGV